MFGFFTLLPIWIYEQFRFCPFKNKNYKKNDFLNIGHRGAAAYEIENTIPAINTALTKYNANAVEIDLSITKDNEIVLWHDWDPDALVSIVRQMGLEPNVKYRPFVPMSGMWRKPVNKLLLNELKEHYGYALKKGYPEKLETNIPTLTEFLDFANTKPSLKAVFLDIKIPINEIDVVALFSHLLSIIIEEYKPKFKIIILSPETEIIKAFKRYLPGDYYSLDVELPFGIILDPEYFSSINKAIKLENRYSSIGRPTVLHLGPWTTYRRIIQYDVNKRRNFNLNNPDLPDKSIIGWTINYKREMKCLLKMGVNGILTDKPDKLHKILK